MFTYGVRNENGYTLMEFVTTHNLMIVNFCFRKRDENLLTFRSGGCSTQIDYLLIVVGILDFIKIVRFLRKMHVLHNTVSYPWIYL